MTPIWQRLGLIVPILLFLLAGAGLLSLGVGTAQIPLRDVASILTGDGPAQEPAATIVRDIRLPRLILAILIGAALAVSGAAMQGFFQNPMADPYIAGVSSGAAFGVTVGMVLNLDFWLVGLSATPILAFAGALGVSFLVYALALRGGRVPVTLLLLIGVAVGALATAATSLLMILGVQDLRQILFWLLGSLSSRRWDHVQMVFPYVALGIVVIWAYARDLNLLVLGEETAHHTGLDVERVKQMVLGASALLAAAAVSVSGLIGFVGLIVPHLVRLIVGPNHFRLIPISALVGALLVVLADMLARGLAAPSEIPIGIVTSALGCPFFLFLLSRRSDVAF